MTEARRRQEGTLAGFLAYLLWGAFPLYFATLRPAGPWEILAHRIVWTLLLCAIVLVLTRDLRWLLELARRPRRAGGVALAGLFIALNWGVYTYAVLSGHVTEAALGYFLNPLVTVALGVVVLREVLSAYSLESPAEDRPKVRNITSVPRRGARVRVVRR